MTNLGKYCNNRQTIIKYKQWISYNYVTQKATLMISREIVRLQEENDFLVADGLNDISKIEIKIEQIQSKISGNNGIRLKNSAAYKFD